MSVIGSIVALFNTQNILLTNIGGTFPKVSARLLADSFRELQKHLKPSLIVD